MKTLLAILSLLMLLPASPALATLTDEFHISNTRIDLWQDSNKMVRIVSDPILKPEVEESKSSCYWEHIAEAHLYPLTNDGHNEYFVPLGIVSKQKEGNCRIWVKAGRFEGVVNVFVH